MDGFRGTRTLQSISSGATAPQRVCCAHFLFMCFHVENVVDVGDEEQKIEHRDGPQPDVEKLVDGHASFDDSNVVKDTEYDIHDDKTRAIEHASVCENQGEERIQGPDSNTGVLEGVYGRERRGTRHVEQHDKIERIQHRDIDDTDGCGDFQQQEKLQEKNEPEEPVRQTKQVVDVTRRNFGVRAQVVFFMQVVHRRVVQDRVTHYQQRVEKCDEINRVHIQRPWECCQYGRRHKILNFWRQDHICIEEALFVSQMTQDKGAGERCSHNQFGPLTLVQMCHFQVFAYDAVSYAQSTQAQGEGFVG